MIKKTPMVSVILPTYNGREEWIRQSIESVLGQTYKDFELIIINDASTNNVEKIIKEYEKMDDRIVYIKNEKNLKLTKTLNKGIDFANGKYIARQDDDDIWQDKEKLEKQIRFLEEHEDYGLCGAGKVVEINEHGDIISESYLRCSDKELRNSILGCNQFFHSSILIRKSILEKTGVYDPKWNVVEDYELWLRVGIQSKFTNLNDTSIKYRINNKGISKTNKRYQKKLDRMLFFKYGKYYPKFLRALFLRIGDAIICDKYKYRILDKLKKMGVL